MTPSNLTGALVLILVCATTFVVDGAVNTTLERVMSATTVISMLWWIIWGHSLKGWIGESYQEMKAEIERLGLLDSKGVYPDGRPIPPAEASEIFRRQQWLMEKIQFHPDNPRNR